ncbi:MAG: alpha/beta hydrolase [Actinomycetota bacterium]|nr:alpha/beta hydrolase [Actinomycetota bacterium]
MTYILGAMDKMTPPKRAADLIAATEGATVVTLPGVGHMMMSEAPDAARRAMVDALESVRV